MKILSFKPSKSFLGDIDLPCVVAKVRNSKLPGVASRHIAETRKDPVCEVYLRSKDTGQVTPWQREILENLLEKGGLAAAVKEAMQEYSGSDKWGGKDYAELSKEDRESIKKHGIESHIAISAIVIDETKRKVILRADTLVDGHLEEHGISIFLSKGCWRFELADYFIRYRSSVAETNKSRGEPSAMDEFQRERKKWDELFPATELDGPPVTDPGLAEGKWALDKVETNKVMKRLGIEGSVISVRIRDNEDVGVSITPTGYELFSLTPPFQNFQHVQFVRFERRGNRVAITTQTSMPEWMRKIYSNDTDTTPSERTTDWWSDGRILVKTGGFVYKPTDQVPVQGKPVPPWELVG